MKSPKVLAGTEPPISGIDQHDLKRLKSLVGPRRLESGLRPASLRYEPPALDVPNERLDEFMSEFLEGYPYESFCFLNIGKIRERVGILRDHFIPEDPRRAIAYSVKANPRRDILKTLMEEGIKHFDCSSPREVQQVKELNEGVKTFYNHPVKSPTAIEMATRMGVSHFTAQTRKEVMKIFANSRGIAGGQPLEIIARLQTNNDQAAIDLSSKFGAKAEEVVHMIQLIRSLFQTVPGISIHTGSQNSDEHRFSASINFMADVAEKAGGVSIMNVGGGIPVNYFPHQTYDFRHFLDIISGAVRVQTPRILKQKDDDQMIAIELGRGIVAEAVDLVIPVLAVEERERPTMYINDGIFTSFSDASIHNWRYNFQPFRPDGEPFSYERKSFVLHGRTCDSGDTLGEVYLPEDIQEGDYLWIPNAGAYMDCQSTHFNGFEPPKYVTYNH